MQAAKPTKKTITVEDYLKALPKEDRARLEHVRKIIRSVVPRAEEVMSYMIPTFKLNGQLIGYAAFKNHCSIFTLSHEVMKQFKEELAPFSPKGITIHFTDEQPMPATLLKKLVKARVVENSLRAEAKKLKKK